MRLLSSLVRRLLNRSILYGSSQSYTYCNCDKIVTFFTGRTTDNLFPVFNYFQLWFWPYEILGNRCQLALFTFVIYTVHNNVCIMHSTYTANLRSSFERLIPSGVLHSFALLLSAAANEWRCGSLDYIMPEVRGWGCGLQSGWDHSCSVISLIACSEYYDQGFGG